MELHLICISALEAPPTAALTAVCFLSPGLSLTGSHLMCGDFLYSGHTVMLTLSYLFIKECQ